MVYVFFNENYILGGGFVSRICYRFRASDVSVGPLLYRDVGDLGLHLAGAALQGMQEGADDASWGAGRGGHPSNGAGLQQSVSNCLCL